MTNKVKSGTFIWRPVMLKMEELYLKSELKNLNAYEIKQQRSLPDIHSEGILLQ